MLYDSTCHHILDEDERIACHSELFKAVEEKRMDWNCMLSYKLRCETLNDTVVS